MCDDTIKNYRQCETVHLCDGNDIGMHLTTMQLNYRPQHDCTFYTPHLVVLLLCTK